jgi:hypothetical protein
VRPATSIVRVSLVCLAAALGAAACRAAPRIAHEPTVRLHTGGPDGPGELGVSTEHGVVFLGRGQTSGPVEFTTWFGDGPSLETGEIEALGGGLYATRSEVRIPSVPIRWREPAPGTRVLVRGRRPSSERFSFEAVVASDPRVDGLCLRSSGSLRGLGDGQAGAGVYLEDERGNLALVGLVTGVLELSGTGGARELVTVAGPRELWRLASQGRELDRPEWPAPREDVLPGS